MLSADRRGVRLECAHRQPQRQQEERGGFEEGHPGQVQESVGRNAQAEAPRRDRQVLADLDPKKIFCLERNASGQPRHPLYVARKTTPVPFV